MNESRTFTKREFDAYIQRAITAGKIEATEQIAIQIKAYAAELFEEGLDEAAVKLRDYGRGLSATLALLNGQADGYAAQNRKDQMMQEAERLNEQFSGDTLPKQFDVNGQPE